MSITEVYKPPFAKPKAPEGANKTHLKVNEIYQSISGEIGGFPQGSWCTFIRLQGCNLACTYCDAKEAASNKQHLGGWMLLGDILEKVQTTNVVITGGEPLMPNRRNALICLLDVLTLQGKNISIETDGSYDIRNFPCVWEGLLPPTPEKVHFVIDVKCPSSGVNDAKQFYGLYNFKRMDSYQLDPDCTILNRFGFKFVVQDNQDLDFAMEFITHCKKYGLAAEAAYFAISPVDAGGPEFVANMLERIHQNWPAMLPELVFNFQIHKVLNLP